MRVVNYLNNEHGLRRDFHIMAELEIGEKHYGLCHAYVAVSFEGHIGKRFSRIHVADNQLCDDI